MFDYENSQNNLVKMNYIEHDLMSCSVTEFYVVLYWQI